jgi:class 3 adenylate cyclase/tetratricopeptide (TPR) repeat protein
MRCDACQTDNPPGARFCNGCGAALSRECPGCGFSNPAPGRFCSDCGSPLAGAPLPAPRFETPRSYTPRELQEKILANRAAIEGQRKQVTIFSADIVGFTPLAERLDPEQTHEIATRCFDILLEHVHRYEGHVAQFTGDGMLALFGAPIAHEDHAQRAVRAALDARRALDAYGGQLRARDVDLRVRLGLNSGRVVVGTVGTDLNITYTASGDSVNLAARVQSLAEPGTVTISHQTERLVRGYFVTSALGQRPVKGRSEQIGLFEVLRPNRWRSRVDARATQGLSPFVGREADLARLLAGFAAAREGRGQVVFVRGEPGIGKSRLLFEAKRRLEGEDLAWIEGRCISYGYDTSYHPIVDLLKDALAIDEGDGEPVVLRRLEAAAAALGEGLRPHLPYLRYLLAVDPGDPAIATMDPTLRRTQVFEAVRAFLVAAAARRPQVVVVEDLHWLDGTSEALLSTLAEAVGGQRILLILTHRPGYEHRLGGRPFFARIDLSPLNPAESAAVARGVLGARDLADDLRDLIAGKAEGNPLFVEEVTRSLVEIQALRRDDRGYGLAARADQIDVPDTVQDVIMARLDRLPDEARRAIQVAAVIGREFTVRLLERAADLGQPLEGHLRELKAVELIFERSLFPELAYMFRHALVHDVAYDSLLLARRKVLHRLVGEAIEDLYRDRLVEHYEMLAYHYARADAWSKVVEYGPLAAEKAVHRLALPDAIRFYDQVVEAAEHLDDLPLATLIATRRALASLYWSVGDFARARAEAEVGVELARRAGDAPGEGGALFDVAWAMFWAEDFPGALAAAHRAAEVAERAGAQSALAASEFMTAYVHAVSGEHADLVPRFVRVAAISRAIGDRSRESLAMQGLGVLHAWRGCFDQAVAQTGEALRIAREHDLFVPLQRNLWGHGVTCASGGRYDEALAALEEGLAIARRIGDESGLPRLLNTIGWLHGECGDLDLAIDLAEQTMQYSRRRRHGIGVEQTAFSLVNIADALMLKCDLAAAGEALDEAQRLIADPTHDWMKWRYSMHAFVSSGELALLRGDLPEAERWNARSLAIAVKTDSRKYLVRGWRLAGEIAAARRDWSEATATLGRAVGLATEIGNPPQLWKTRAALGRALDAAGERDRAGEAYRAALEAVEATRAGLRDGRLRTSFDAARETGELERLAGGRRAPRAGKIAASQRPAW